MNIKNKKGEDISSLKWDELERTVAEKVATFQEKNRQELKKPLSELDYSVYSKNTDLQEEWSKSDECFVKNIHEAVKKIGSEITEPHQKKRIFNLLFAKKPSEEFQFKSFHFDAVVKVKWNMETGEKTSVSKSSSDDEGEHSGNVIVNKECFWVPELVEVLEITKKY